MSRNIVLTMAGILAAGIGVHIILTPPNEARQIYGTIVAAGTSAGLNQLVGVLGIGMLVMGAGFILNCITSDPKYQRWAFAAAGIGLLAIWAVIIAAAFLIR
ncbi:MAG TPA: hypothetical protein VNG29_03120 [Candidatus Paceibacterota bacterium]|nr:hypothetical protein [Candidatus Paceibacterota bacterium]